MRKTIHCDNCQKDFYERLEYEKELDKLCIRCPDCKQLLFSQNSH